ncbi:uncharacterized protein C8A04DRAFT_24045 [Dichotomopilus funicola]|uniref:Ubiquitin-like domain-containing protein n=1 Tax=Dichotomopilus funicola TaxID=1934379 RepID=A0AAN6VBB3_9PEZI|nr:hypothetical protein C8A04DRAFT_24045 [Dichotomopilus funicola]
MAGEQSDSAPSGSQDDAALVVNLQIVSPSVGVGTLRFPDIPATATVQQLKQKIRGSLTSRPADDQQRLIHRGRLLARESDTLQDIFGEALIRSNELQTIHLVLRDTGEGPPPSELPPRQLPHPIRNAPNVSVPRPGSEPPSTGQATAQFPQLPYFQQSQAQLQDLQHRVTHFQDQQREALYRQLLAQNQAHRTATAAHPLQNGGNSASDFRDYNPQTGGADRVDGRNSPVGQAFRTVTREGTGPDGQRYSFRVTVNEFIAPAGASSRQAAGPGSTAEPPGQHPLSPTDVRSITHGPDAVRATQTMANAMQRNTSGAQPANMATDIAQLGFNSAVQPIQPGVTTPIFPGLSRNGSRTATPDIPVRSISRGSGIGYGGLHTAAQPQAHGYPEVYIISSPMGPRGLLIHNGSELYATPVVRPLPWTPNFYRPPFPTSLPAGSQVHQGIGHGTPGGLGHGQDHAQAANAQPDQPPHPLPDQRPLPQPRHEVQPGIRRRPVVGQGLHPPPAPPAEAQQAPQVHPHGNPGVAPLVAAAWPHIWLVVRLVAFAWWFSYTNPSWERWLSLVLAFIVVLGINTGLFNGMVNNAFHPMREQLEGMIPFADPERQQEQQRQQRQQQNVPDAAPHQDGGDGIQHPDPAQTAARLVAQRRAQNGSWLRDHYRRIERASILFLASFAPGVAERHIRELEEQERAERRAAEEARAAAAAAAAAAAEAEAAAQQEAEQGGTGNQEEQGNDRNEAQDGDTTPQQHHSPQVQSQPPLVEA